MDSVPVLEKTWKFLRATMRGAVQGKLNSVWLSRQIDEAAGKMIITTMPVPGLVCIYIKGSFALDTDGLWNSEQPRESHRIDLVVSFPVRSQDWREEPASFISQCSNMAEKEPRLPEQQRSPNRHMVTTNTRAD